MTFARAKPGDADFPQPGAGVLDGGGPPEVAGGLAWLVPFGGGAVPPLLAAGSVGLVVAAGSPLQAASTKKKPKTGLDLIARLYDTISN